jgi:hypothetical protein
MLPGCFVSGEKFMYTKAELGPKSPHCDPGEFLMFVNLRLKKLRHERDLVERAIVALTAVSRGRKSRGRRSGPV